MLLKRMICVIGVATAVLGSAGVATAATATVTEAGSTLVYPIASVWAARYPGNNIDTAPGGSDKGIQAVSSGQVDIGAADSPMTPSQYGVGPADYVQIPWALSATGIGYNLPGVKDGLHLTGPILAEIYTGRISRWGDPAIVGLNRSNAAALRRAGRILPVFRSDGSGESYSIQQYMSRSAPSVWKLGVSDAFGGTTGVSANGNGGVAAAIEANRGTIGYLSGAYLLQQHLSVAAIANAAGHFEVPNIENLLAAAAADPRIPAQGPNFTGVPVVDPPARDGAAYPIATYSYAIVARSDTNLAAVQSFLDWVISVHGGQEYGISLDFAPLPAAIRSADAALINGL